ncbi:hypothetical protein BO94DRAFT_197624 [Aspergillus sclerotioniger CBS 115572]|uniref:Uncharacterized protein n=1 Tax=Aspergillus sclerotioniger CBS 115572 TaxID=1450535 RepID=A0A317VTL1_9EURO|nr:hypothetical protein BO94DRAFT_197624 [Aspergillus sclerotioniger CBS 115572]PWY76357.1 hypothetical protein BO94DRAFT_197624 [Aspergillus sclerotioniger CBS 115572]
MGGFLSVQSKEKRRRSNRLSKPPPNKAALGSASSRASHQASSSNSPTCPQAAAWQNPWTGTSIPVSAPESDTGGRRSQSLPSVSYQPGAPWPSVSKTRKCQSMVKAPDDLGLHTYVRTASMSDPMGGQASRRSSRQRGFQTTTTQNGPEPSIARQPSRSYSTHSPPQRAQSTMHHSTIEEATSSNTLFMVDSQGFSLIRRRSLLTRPGVATRRSTRDTARRLSSPVDQETNASINYRNGTYIPSRLLLSDCEDGTRGPSGPLPQLRPPTPNDFEYTHLGALKLGSLRVVNGSTSPCPSDRIRLNRPNSPIIEANDLGTHGLEPKQPIEGGRHHAHRAPIHLDCESLLAHGSVPGPSQDAGLTRSSGHDEPKNSDGGSLMNKDYPMGLHENRACGSMLQISAISDIGKHEDYPESPFSFEKSPTISSACRLRGSEIEDEGICVPDEEKMFVPQLDCAFRDYEHRELQHPHKKVDSGYSSAASVRSTRKSTDSHSSARQSGGPRRFTFGGSPRDLETWDVKTSSNSEDHLPLYRRSSLHDPIAGPNVEICGWSTHGTSMCHDSQRIPMKERLRSSSFTASHESRHAMSLSQYCHQLRSLDTSSTGISVVTTDAVPHSFPKICAMKQPMETTKEYDAQASSSSMGTARLPKPNLDVFGMSVPESAGDVGSGRPAFGPPRGRARSRSIECQQKRLTKHAKRPNLYMAASPFIFH